MKASLMQFIQESQSQDLPRLSYHQANEIAAQYEHAFAMGVECNLDKVVKIAQRTAILNDGCVDIVSLIAICLP